LSLNSPEFSFFLEALETFENLLHAETQAIAAKHLETIEDIIERKDENLKALLDAKERIGINPRSEAKADELVDQVLDLQEKNVESFRKLFAKQFKANHGKETQEKPIERKLKKAYLTNEQTRHPELGG
jgi:hypothetical protein